MVEYLTTGMAGVAGGVGGRLYKMLLIHSSEVPTS